MSPTDLYICSYLMLFTSLSLCVCMPKFVCARVRVSRGQKSILNSLELELQAVVSTPK